jgi:DNA-binding GntR family transcriptional regulator
MAESHSLQLPLFERVRSVLAKRIRSGAIPPGQVLIEGPIAGIFGSSRAPVRKALRLLHEEGLVQRFQGRGYLAGTGRHLLPVRTALSTDLLDREDADDLGSAVSRSRSDVVLVSVRLNASIAMAFGEFRINQSLLAEHFGVSRIRAAEVLARLRDQRIVRRDDRGHWLVGPLTARAVRDEYELRAILEPIALRHSAKWLESDEIEAMQERIDSLVDREHELELHQIERVESDLHEFCLARSTNQRMLNVIERSQLPILVNNVFLNAVGLTRELPELKEHQIVLRLLRGGNVDAAAQALAQHLNNAGRRTMQRLKSLSVLPEPELPDYLVHL